ncbi:MAG: hypothetical protein JNM68_11065, partial [Dinghuibacter sp.]|nr:hypothetical protein [Dinghuibacter sp.]
MENMNIARSEQITRDLLPRKFGKWGKIWTASLIVICLVGAFAYYRQLKHGLSVTNMGDYVS